MMTDTEIEAVLNRALPIRPILIEAASKSDAIWRNAYRLADITAHEALFLRNYIGETYAGPDGTLALARPEQLHRRAG